MLRRVLGTVAVGAGGALTAMLLKPDRVHASRAMTTEKPQFWDHNWDFRDPCSCVTKLKSPSDPAEQNKRNEQIEASTPTAIRHILLVRHGQYLSSKATDPERKLTSLGREQADLTGRRLKALGIKFDRIVNSTMTRATETADIICNHISGPREKCNLIREGAPCQPEPKLLAWQPAEKDFFQEGAVIEAGFRKYFHRADPEQKTDSYELLVCHANVIRYFVCRALQLPPEAWLRFSLNNGSITWVSIHPTGKVLVRCIGDSGYMPPDKLSSY
ncbi:serine/threonine-protein phosphatase PGAM5, mitochondrial [Galendromus occidentalis]|uniref:Serine/threonine-protein phosphatase PGAM5, mitochondrial n=1 Tax=Galendromus occidentalis TaxID=34638 RepID=A0AAJ6VYB1_9ACAR|nr:serine/threonine-protein phosphatase PGAM5, mitochondrial [Galendromus occidentalis]